MASDTRRTCLASKYLFNFKLKGVIQEDIIANENEWYSTSVGEKIMELRSRMEELELKNDAESIKEYVDSYRKSAEMEMVEFGKDAIFTESKENCVETSLTVSTTHHGNYDVPVHIRKFWEIQIILH